MSTFISLDNKNFDLNSMFTFNYELLKQLIETLARNQNETNKKLLELEIQAGKKEKKIKK